ncbi:MAG: long-chain acyl-CoA synthetase [Actinomycetota bacterium]|nr:long-chain acyl-CoA synthetase [Actinomycetota bacterium]
MTSHLNLATLLADSAARHPSRPALVAGDTTLGFAKLDAFARTFAGVLADLGVRPGEHVALLLPNVPQFTVAYFGAHYAGTPVVPLNVLLTADELAYHLEDSQATVVVAWESFLGPLQEAVARVGTVRHVIVVRADLTDLSAPDGCRNLVALMAAAAPVATPHPTAADDTAVVLYTSGTTGQPKGAELTHANLVSNARAAAGLVDLDESTVALVALPLFHAFGMTVMHNAVLSVGGSLVLVPRFNAPGVLQLMSHHRVTFLGGVPTMFMALLEAAPADCDLPSLRWCVSGGAPMPASVMAEFEARFGVTLLEGYGLSETSPAVSFTVPDRPRTPGSIGYPLPGVDVRLVDDGGHVVTAPDTAGEIQVRGPNVMKGYWRNPSATAEAVVDGWFHTGDIGMTDADGALRIVDRKKDLIIRAGYNVYPREVEGVLHLHPAVALAAVVGVPDRRRGEEVKAVVTLKPGTTATPTEIVAFCRRHLASYKYPRLVEVRDSMPLGPTGKILKNELRASA